VAFPAIQSDASGAVINKVVPTDPEGIPVTVGRTADSEELPTSDEQLCLKKAVSDEFGEGDKLNAVYPEKLISSVPGSDEGYVRGELLDVRREITRTRDVYLGAEEDDEATEERNEDRFDDDEREFDQDGREFLKIRPIIWRKQFLTRHGDPGINVWRFLVRIFYGLVPKLAADGRLQKAVAGSTLKSFFTGDLSVLSNAKNDDSDLNVSTMTGTAHQRGLGGRIALATRNMARGVKDQAKLVEQKLRHPKNRDTNDQPQASSADASVPRRDDKAAESGVRSTSNVAQVRQSEDYYENRGEEQVGKPSDMKIHRVQERDVDANKSPIVTVGTLEAVWQGRHRITSLFRRWKTWHVEIKNDAVFYHRVHQLSSFPQIGSSPDSVWFTLDLAWLSDLFITDSSRSHNNELVLKFVQDDSTLHFRLPKGTSSPSLDEWLDAFRKVSKAQQDRRRLGTVGTLSAEADTQHSTGTWPGEDRQPQQRQRGSSLALDFSAPLKRNEKVSINVDKPFELAAHNIETSTKPQDMLNADEEMRSKQEEQDRQRRETLQQQEQVSQQQQEVAQRQSDIDQRKEELEHERSQLTQEQRDLALQEEKLSQQQRQVFEQPPENMAEKGFQQAQETVVIDSRSSSEPKTTKESENVKVSAVDDPLTMSQNVAQT